MATPKNTTRRPQKRPFQATREGAVLVAAVGAIVAAVGSVAMGGAIIGVAALVFALGLANRPARAPARIVTRAPRPPARRRRPRRP